MLDSYPIMSTLQQLLLAGCAPVLRLEAAAMGDERFKALRLDGQQAALDSRESGHLFQ